MRKSQHTEPESGKNCCFDMLDFDMHCHGHSNSYD
jgi:hypothetical protein